ncbi:MAG TPA: GNAT family N-acetyltransferase [Terracidiphilus sp.]|nr:GNAT family N-acetyltransferase [Terracidiphilus sp.]
MLRTASPGDLRAVGALLETSFSRLLAGSYDAKLLELALPHMVNANPILLACGTYYVVEAEAGAVVACGGWTYEEPGSGAKVNGEAHIRHFAVHPDWVRRGIGAALLTRCIAEAELAGVKKLRCLSTLNAEPFYRASGFRTVSAIDVRMGQTLLFPAVQMERGIR